MFKAQIACLFFFLDNWKNSQSFKFHEKIIHLFINLINFIFESSSSPLIKLLLSDVNIWFTLIVSIVIFFVSSQPPVVIDVAFFFYCYHDILWIKHLSNLHVNILFMKFLFSPHSSNLCLQKWHSEKCSTPPTTPLDCLALKRHRFFNELLGAAQSAAEHRVRFDPLGPFVAEAPSFGPEDYETPLNSKLKTINLKLMLHA